MVEPTGYTALDLLGFTDKGPYDPTANYVRNDLVHVGNSTWRCKIDDTTGITPTEGANWTIFIESATSLAGMSDVELNTPKAGDGLVHNGNDWTNIPIMTKDQWKKNGAYNICPNNATPQVVNQITYAVNSSNKTITATWSTTPSGNSPLLIAARGALKLKAGTTYKLVGCPTGGGWSAGNFKYRVFIQDNTATTDIQDTGSGVVFTPTEDHEYTVYIAIAQHAGASGNLIFKPMVTTDLNATYDDYEAYAKTNGELTEDLDGDAITFTTSTSGISNIFGNGTKVGNVCNVSFYYAGNTNTSTAIGVLSEKPKVRTYISGVVTLSDNSTMVGPFVIETNGNVVQQVTNGTIAKAAFSGSYLA